MVAMGQACSASKLSPLAAASNAAADEIGGYVAEHRQALAIDMRRRLTTCAPLSALEHARCRELAAAEAFAQAAPESAVLWQLAALQHDARSEIAAAEECAAGHAPGCDLGALQAEAGALLAQLEGELAIRRARTSAGAGPSPVTSAPRPASSLPAL
jgi:hypothetical protein